MHLCRLPFDEGVEMKQPEPEKMTFCLEEKEPFEKWFHRVHPRLTYLAYLIGRASRTEVQAEKQEDLAAHLTDLLDDLSNVKLEVSELNIRATEYLHDYVAKETERLMKVKVKGKPVMAPKTAQDYCVKFNSPEKRILTRIEAMTKTIDIRITVSQSLLRNLKP